MKLQTIKRPRFILTVILMRFNPLFPTKLYLKLLFKLRTGHFLNLKKPQTFGEKIQWLKVYNRQNYYSTLVDKVEVKNYVAPIVGAEHVIPTIGVWDRPENIDWESLPNQFVLKTSHGGGSSGVVICKEKLDFDKKKAIDKLNRSMKQDIWGKLREWPYKNVKPRILAEKYIEPNLGNDLSDYKWYCFNGKPKYCQVIQDRTSKETIDFFDVNWNHQEFVGLNPKADRAVIPPQRPKNLEKQIEIATSLSKNIPFVRIDLYEIDDSVFFGEITFYPMSGMGRFRPDEYNKILGEMIELPKL